MRDCSTILHPTDFSRPAMYAFRVARALARSSGCTLLVIHVAPARVYRKRGQRRELEEALRRLTTSDPTVQMHGLLLAGDPAAQIVCTAGQVDCDVIVMGANGRTAMSRLLKGSVARAVHRGAPCPVMTVRLPDGGVSSHSAEAIGTVAGEPVSAGDLCCMATGGKER